MIWLILYFIIALSFFVFCIMRYRGDDLTFYAWSSLLWPLTLLIILPGMIFVAKCAIQHRRSKKVKNVEI